MKESDTVKKFLKKGIEFAEKNGAVPKEAAEDFKKSIDKYDDSTTEE